jgi:hypothetical protein
MDEFTIVVCVLSVYGKIKNLKFQKCDGNYLDIKRKQYVIDVVLDQDGLLRC